MSVFATGQHFHSLSFMSFLGIFFFLFQLCLQTKMLTEMCGSYFVCCECTIVTDKLKAQELDAGCEASCQNPVTLTE